MNARRPLASPAVRLASAASVPWLSAAIARRARREEALARIAAIAGDDIDMLDSVADALAAGLHPWQLRLIAHALTQPQAKDNQEGSTHA